MQKFKFCPHCANGLIDDTIEGLEYRVCKQCEYTHWDNPIPAVATLIPMDHLFLTAADISTEGIPNGGIVLVKRGIPPFKGQYCLPCGYLRRHGHPKAEAVREAKEESGLVVRIEQLVSVCNPMPNEINQLVLHYVARPVGGALRAGDDAADVGVFTPDTLPQVCFRSHLRIIEEWFAGKLGTLTGIDLIA